MAAALPVLGFFIAQWCMVCLCLEERFTGTLRMCAFLAGMNGNPFGGDGVSAVGFYSTTGLFSGGDSLSDTRERSNRGADSFTNFASRLHATPEDLRFRRPNEGAPRFSGGA